MILAGKLALLYLGVGLCVLTVLSYDWREVREFVASAFVFVLIWLLWPVALAADIHDRVRRWRARRT